MLSGKLLLTICFIASFARALAGQTPRAVEIEYSLVSAEVPRREPVLLEFRLINNLDEAIQTDLGWQGAQSFRFTIFGPSKSIIDFIPPLKEGFTPTGDVTVAPGASYTKRLLLNDWFDFDAEGRYRITVLLAAPIKDKQGRTVASDPGGHLELMVMPPDSGKLKKSCKEWLSKIRAAQSYGEAEISAKALATVRDPVAVPFLAEATKYWHLENITTRALAEIGDTTAADVLISMLDSGGDKTLLARSALMRLQRQSKDPALVNKISSTLKNREHHK